MGLFLLFREITIQTGGLLKFYVALGDKIKNSLDILNCLRYVYFLSGRKQGM